MYSRSFKSYGISKSPFSIIKEWVDKDFSNRCYEVTFNSYRREHTTIYNY